MSRSTSSGATSVASSTSITGTPPSMRYRNRDVGHKRKPFVSSLWVPGSPRGKYTSSAFVFGHTRTSRSSFDSVTPSTYHSGGVVDFFGRGRDFVFSGARYVNPYDTICGPPGVKSTRTLTRPSASAGGASA